MEESTWVSIAEAARLTGLSIRTVKRMADEGKLQSSKTPGMHGRVLRADVEKLLRPAGPAAANASVSSMLAVKQEEVESLSLDLRARQARRELSKLDEQDAEAKREQKEARRAQTFAAKQALAQVDLQRKRDAEQREREKREAEAQRRKSEFQRRWLRWASSRLFDWLSFEQQQIVLRQIEETLSGYGPENEQLMQHTLDNVTARVCKPWEVERQASAKREKLIEETLRGLPYGASDAEKARAAADVRSALYAIPLTAGDLEARAAASATVAPVVKTIEDRKAGEREQEEETRRADRRKQHKEDLVRAGVNHVMFYLLKLRLQDRIDQETSSDSDYRHALEEAAREVLQDRLTGDEKETRAHAEAIVEELIEEDLEREND